MAKNNFIDGKVYKYASIEEALLSATRITNLKTGESVKLIGNAKLAYMILRKRFYHFTKPPKDKKYFTKGKHYDTIESIAAAIGVSDVGTVRSAIGSLEAAGLLTKRNLEKLMNGQLSISLQNYFFSNVTPGRQKSLSGWIV